jgi:hypothetical protein
MWGTREPFPTPYSAFNTPVSPPSADPDGGDSLVTVTFSRDWLPVVLGACTALTLQSTWKGDVATVELAILRAELLLDIIAKSGGIPMLPPPAPQRAEYGKFIPAPGAAVPSVALTRYDLDFPSSVETIDQITRDAGGVLFSVADGLYHYHLEASQFSNSASWVELIDVVTGNPVKRGPIAWYGPAILDGWLNLAPFTGMSLKFQQFFYSAAANGREATTTESYWLRRLTFERYQYETGA